ncbi:MAG: c-type cytochrome [Anaerolineae bacterium]|nr:MAG: c-type cytochrome [Anaerolineae bacterium]
MNEQEKKDYLDSYKKKKEKGLPFFPDILFKDAVISLVIFLALIALAYFVGAPLEERANPADATYTPRPEWYFLFLFQLLKYFPGNLEVIGVVVIPTLAILLLFGLPFLDASRFRHFSKRRWVTVLTTLGMLGIIGLTVLSINEAPPPEATASGDATAALYAANCAACHGPSIQVPEGANLHEIIAQGGHEGMPAWGADLTSDQIDALAGFILSPKGSQFFAETCGACHSAEALVASEPVELKNALLQGTAYPAHEGVEGVEQWAGLLSLEEQTALLNFLVAPDGQRLFATNCASCHGASVAVSGTEEELSATIRQGGLHLEMPAWGDRLTEEQIRSLAGYVVDPETGADGKPLYQERCTACHPARVPSAGTMTEAIEIITTGGSHETMPVWGDLLTPEQLDALVTYTWNASLGTGSGLGQDIFSQNCSSCHGAFGEGGPNPTRAGDIIAPISTAEYLKTRDDITLRAIIAQGQPNFGMSPFGLAYGGPLDDANLDALVAFLRSWEANPPVDLPPDVQSDTVSLTGGEIFATVCSQCHGINADGGVGPSLRTAAFQSSNTSESIFNTINDGHENTAMIAWGGILSSQQIQDIVDFLLSLPESEGGQSGAPSFRVSVLPILQAKCEICHSASDPGGGWVASDAQSVITSGDNGPAVIPGDVAGSILAQKIQNLQTFGDKMPPRQELSAESIQVILDWIAAGAPDN